MKKQRKNEKPFEPVFFFGYGSLLWPPGINGRGMRYEYETHDLIPARLHGFKRSFCAHFQGLNFYGLLPDEKATVNGIILPIFNRKDYRALLANEGAVKAFGPHQVYWTTRVTNSMEYLKPHFRLPKGWRVMTLVCHDDKSGQGIISPWYVGRCHEFAKKWGKDFEKEFLATGGWSMADWNRYHETRKPALSQLK